MSAYRRRRVVIAAVLIAYALAAVVVKTVVRRDREVFPVFAWSLFSTVESEPTEYAIRLTSVNGDAGPGGKLLEDALGAFAPVRSAAELWATTQKFGDAVEAGNVEDGARWRRLLEANFLSGHGTVRYELIQIRYRTLERAATGAVRSARAIASFTADG